MAVIHTTDKEKKRRLMRAVVDACVQLCPWYLDECVSALRETKKSEFDPKTGKLRAEARGEMEHGGYIRVRFPRELFFLMRRFWPSFGDDDSDLKLLADEFPDLVQHRGGRLVHK